MQNQSPFDIARAHDHASARRSRRPASHWTWADKYGSRLNQLLPATACPAAAATCRFHLRGKNANRNGAYAWACHTSMQTFGETPHGCHVSHAGQTIQMTSAADANAVLQVFGLSVTDMIDHYGIPADDAEYRIDLYDVVRTLAPCSDLTICEPAAAAAVAA